MECAICYSEIKDHKLFKAGCCSINICIDCVKIGKLKECPQCKESYGWIGPNNEEEIEELKGKIEEYETDIYVLKSSKKIEESILQSKITHYKNELDKKDKYIDQLSNIIVQLIVEEEEEEAEAELIEDFQDVVNRLNLIP